MGARSKPNGIVVKMQKESVRSSNASDCTPLGFRVRKCVPQARRVILSEVQPTNLALSGAFTNETPSTARRKRRRSQLSLETPPAPCAGLPSTVSPLVPQVKNCGVKMAKRSRSPKFRMKEVVSVAPRTWPGINKLGGTGRITRVYDDCRYDVSYVLGGNEKGVEEKYISRGKFTQISDRPVKPRDFFYDYDQLKEVLKHSKKEKAGETSFISPIAQPSKRKTPGTASSRRSRSSSKKSKAKIRPAVELLIPKPPSVTGSSSRSRSSLRNQEANLLTARIESKSKQVSQRHKPIPSVSASNMLLKTINITARKIPPPLLRTVPAKPFAMPTIQVQQENVNRLNLVKTPIRTPLSQDTQKGFKTGSPVPTSRIGTFLKLLEDERFELEERHKAEVQAIASMKAAFLKQLESTQSYIRPKCSPFEDICARVHPSYKPSRKPLKYATHNSTDIRFARLETLLMARQELEIERLYKAQLRGVENNSLRLPKGSLRRAKSAFSF